MHRAGRSRVSWASQARAALGTAARALVSLSPTPLASQRGKSRLWQPGGRPEANVLVRRGPNSQVLRAMTSGSLLRGKNRPDKKGGGGWLRSLTKFAVVRSQSRMSVRVVCGVLSVTKISEMSDRPGCLQA